MRPKNHFLKPFNQNFRNPKNKTCAWNIFDHLFQTQFQGWLQLDFFYQKASTFESICRKIFFQHLPIIIFWVRRNFTVLVLLIQLFIQTQFSPLMQTFFLLAGSQRYGYERYRVFNRNWFFKLVPPKNTKAKKTQKMITLMNSVGNRTHVPP